MTDTPKPLTADEIAERKRMIAELGGNRFEGRYIATIEQQREQIEKLTAVRDKLGEDNYGLAAALREPDPNVQRLIDAAQEALGFLEQYPVEATISAIRHSLRTSIEALAPTDPVNDK